MLRDTDMSEKKPGGPNKYQINYLPVKQRYRNNVKNFCSYPGADANTDHNMLMIKVRLILKTEHGAKKVQKWDVGKLKQGNNR